jgi:uncharacterized membrane protein
MKTALFGLLSVAYPVAIWFFGKSLEPKYLALFLVLLAALRLAATREKMWIAVALGALFLAGVTGALNASWPLRWYPVMVNGSLLSLFGVSLLKGPTVVERLARLRKPSLSPAGVAYTRTVTKVWCGFFAVNGALAALTALLATDAQWALYNGAIAYVLMGLVGAGEYLVRRVVVASHE